MALVWSHVGLNVTDMKRSTTFYTEVFGFKVVSQTQIGGAQIAQFTRLPPPVTLNNTMLSHSDFRLELLNFVSPPELPWKQRYLNEPGMSHLGFLVPVAQLDALCARVAAYGGALIPESVVPEIGDSRSARYVRDPDGQLIAFFINTQPDAALTWTHFGLGVSDPRRSRYFYENVFHFERIVERELSGDRFPVLMQLPPPVTLVNYLLYRPDLNFRMEFLHTKSPPMRSWRERALNEPGLTHNAWRVPVAELDDLKGKINQFGGKVLEETNFVADPKDPASANRAGACYFRDPDGQLLALFPLQNAAPR